MNGREVVKIALQSTQQNLSMYLADMSDEEIRIRPVPGANTIAWQLAHLIVAEKFLLDGELPGVTYPAIPAALAEFGSERTGKVDPPGGYLPKAQYLETFMQMRGATITAVDKITDSDLDKPVKNVMAKHAPTLGALLILTANHTLMHSGQFTVTRRLLKKPVLF
jgi:uncharacterized damage-inducible protein DinB